MDIDVAVFAGLQLISGHKKLPVQLFVQFIEDQAPLCGHQRTVRIGIALISNVTDGLAFGVHLIHHMDKIHFVIPVIPVAFRHRRIYLLKSALHNVVHILNDNALRPFPRKLRGSLGGIIADKLQLFL